MSAPTAARVPVLSTAVRVLTFRATREELLALDRRHLAFGLLATWLVGIGRYWDSPRAEFLQRLGVGSVIYVFALALFLWLVLWPLRPAAWSFERLLTFITLVAPPAALYAIPVERFMSLGMAQEVNTWFLAVVATWRVALLFFFLIRLASLRWFEVIVASLMPLAMIVTALAMLNLEHVVFDLMAGIRPEQRSPNDGAYQVLVGLTVLSLTSFPVLFAGYLGLVIFKTVRRRRALRASSSPNVVPPPSPRASEAAALPAPGSVPPPSSDRRPPSLH